MKTISLVGACISLLFACSRPPGPSAETTTPQPTVPAGQQEARVGDDLRFTVASRWTCHGDGHCTFARDGLMMSCGASLAPAGDLHDAMAILAPAVQGARLVEQSSTPVRVGEHDAIDVVYSRSAEELAMTFIGRELEQEGTHVAALCAGSPETDEADCRTMLNTLTIGDSATGEGELVHHANWSLRIAHVLGDEEMSETDGGYHVFNTQNDPTRPPMFVTVSNVRRLDVLLQDIATGSQASISEAAHAIADAPGLSRAVLMMHTPEAFGRARGIHADGRNGIIFCAALGREDVRSLDAEIQASIDSFDFIAR